MSVRTSGTCHARSGPQKPHNSLDMIDDRGGIVDRYDKTFCAGDRAEDTDDLAHYSPGVHLGVFEIGGIRCPDLPRLPLPGALPRIQAQGRATGVPLLPRRQHPVRDVQSHAQAGGAENRRFNTEGTIPGITMPATMIAEAANNHVWISCPNSSAPESLWPSLFVRPDGVVTGRLRRHAPGVLISEVGTDAGIYDSTVAWRERAMDGVLHSGTLVRDERSEARTRL